MSFTLQAVLAAHLDPDGGTPYWLQRERELGFSLREEIRDVADLARLGPFDVDALRTRPVTDFIPRRLLEGTELVFGETGGATGIPATTAYSTADFAAAFVQPFMDCVDCAETFGAGYWLWLGPGGPHIIGKAAQAIARLTTDADAFSVDFDPRWYRRLGAGSMARARYIEHLLEQAGQVIQQQDIRYLFCTPLILLALLQRMSAVARAAIRFVYLGGMTIEPEALQKFGAALPGADFLSGYGNTLFGVTHELAPGRANGGVRRYFPATERLSIRIVPSACADADNAVRLQREVPYGETGQVVMSRLDESGFLPNVMERDRAVRLRPAARNGADGLGDPRPPPQHQLQIDNGIY